MKDFWLRVFYKLPLPTYPYKMYMHKHKCIFIHIPKNAGTSVLQALGYSGGRYHVCWQHFRASNIGWFNRYHKFSICRHPLERASSAYRYILNGGNQSPRDRALQSLIKQHSSDFDSFVQNLLDASFVAENELFYPQYLFIYDNFEQLKVDSLLRFEDLEIQWPLLAKKLGIPASLSRINSSSKKSGLTSTNMLSEASLHKLHSLYEKDFRLLGYTL